MPRTTWMFLLALGAACDGVAGTEYCCSYESRHTGCGGVDWTDWVAEAFSFDLEDYRDDWDADRVCNQFSGSDEECGGGCCIYVEYRDTTLQRGACAEGS